MISRWLTPTKPTAEPTKPDETVPCSGQSRPFFPPGRRLRRPRDKSAGGASSYYVNFFTASSILARFFSVLLKACAHRSMNRKKAALASAWRNPVDRISTYTPSGEQGGEQAARGLRGCLQGACDLPARCLRRWPQRRRSDGRSCLNQRGNHGWRKVGGCQGSQAQVRHAVPSARREG